MEILINVVETLTKYKQNLIIRDRGQYSDKSVAECSNLTMKEVAECLDFAIDTMRKYQKIKKIVNNTFQNIAKEDERYAYEWLGDIKEVLENDN